MNSRFTFRSWILMTLVPALVALAGAWATHVHRSTHRIILEGFDRKLLAVAGGSAALVDGDAHAAYQQRRELTAFASASPGEFIGVDSARQQFVRVNSTTGAAQHLAALPPSGLRVLVRHPEDEPGLLGLSKDGSSILVLGTACETRTTIPLSRPVDGVFSDRTQLLAWAGRALCRIDLASGAVADLGVTLPEPVASLVAHPASGEWLGLSGDSSALIAFSPDGRVVRRMELHPSVDLKPGVGDAKSPGVQQKPPPRLNVLGFASGTLHAAGRSLAKIDPATGGVVSSGFSPGFFDVTEPFYTRHRAAFSWIEKQAGLSFLYTQVYTGDGRIYYVLDGTLGDGFSRPGAVDELPAASQSAAELVQLAGRSWVSPIQNWQAWGLLKSCFTPVRTSDGKTAAMAGADVDITLIRRKTRWALAAAILIGVGSLIGASVVSVRVAQLLTRPLQHLKESALWLAAGHYGTAIRAKGSREVGALAAILDRLRDRLAEEHERSEVWLAEIRSQRERIALVHTLDELTVHTGTAADAAGATGAFAGADCHVWWMGVTGDDPAEAACKRMRVTLLIREALRAGTLPAGLISLLLASHPDLRGAACWDRLSGVLHFNVNGAVDLCAPSGNHRCEGTGQLRLATVDWVRWTEGALRSS